MEGGVQGMQGECEWCSGPGGRMGVSLGGEGNSLGLPSGSQPSGGEVRKLLTDELHKRGEEWRGEGRRQNTIPSAGLKEAIAVAIFYHRRSLDSIVFNTMA